MENITLLKPKELQSGCCHSSYCHPKHFIYRAIILFFTCFMTFGSFFCYDNPASLQTMFMNDLDLSFQSYMGLYSWYAWPNIVMGFIAGFLIDNILGIRLGAIIFGFITIIGQLLLALGVYVNKLWLMDLARLIFGIGSESLAVAQNTYAAIWFRDKELNIVFGLQISISRIGSTINSNVMPLIYNSLNSYVSNQTSLTLSLLLASITCVISFIFCIILGYLDLRAFKLGCNLFPEETRSKLRILNIFKFNYGVWILSIICVLFYCSIFPFVSIAQTLFMQKYNVNIITANFASSLIYIISACASPFIGFGVDIFGRNLIWLTSGLGILLLSHAIVAFRSDLNVFIITILMGLAYSIVACSLWGLVTYMVSRNKNGTAFGLMQSLMNLGLGSISLICGYILDNYGYFPLEIFFVHLLMLSFCFLIFLFKWSFKHNNILNITAKQRHKYFCNNK